MLKQIAQLRQSSKFAELPTWMQARIEKLLQDLSETGFDAWQPDVYIDFASSILIEDLEIDY